MIGLTAIKRKDLGATFSKGIEGHVHAKNPANVSHSSKKRSKKRYIVVGYAPSLLFVEL